CASAPDRGTIRKIYLPSRAFCPPPPRDAGSLRMRLPDLRGTSRKFQNPHTRRKERAAPQDRPARLRWWRLWQGPPLLSPVYCACTLPTANAESELWHTTQLSPRLLDIPSTCDAAGKSTW